MKKIQCHERWSTKKPPSSGPITVETPKTAPKKPWYFPRSRGGTTSPITAIVVTIKPPPPIPWSARKAISCAMVCASPQSTEPTRKITIAVWSTIFRP